MSNTQNENSMTNAQSANAPFISRRSEQGVDIEKAIEKVLLIFKVTLNTADDDQYNSAIIACKSKARLMELINGAPFDYSTGFSARHEYTSIQFDKEFYIHPDQVIDGQRFEKIEEIGLYTYPHPDEIDTIVIESDFNGA